MPREKVIQLYKFNELDDRAKERAREWYTSNDYPHDEWWDCVYEDFQTICGIIGIELDTKPVRLMNGMKRQKPQIYFSGFWSQGDGACFDGTYRQGGRVMENLKAHAPLDTELHSIAQALEEVQDRHNQQIVADISTRGNYCHSGTMSVYVHDVEDSEGNSVEVPSEDCDTIQNNLHWLADWLYQQLEKSYEWYMSEEVVDENIIANEYEFDEYGNPA